MLKKSTVNSPSPLIKEASPRGKGIPGGPPQAKAKTGGAKDAVLVSEAKPAGRNSTTSTFRAPRGKDDSGDPMCCGYTKLKM